MTDLNEPYAPVPRGDDDDEEGDNVEDDASPSEECAPAEAPIAAPRLPSTPLPTVAVAALSFLAGSALGFGLAGPAARGGRRAGGSGAGGHTASPPPPPPDFAHTPRGSALLLSLTTSLDADGPRAALVRTSDLLSSDDEFAESCHPVVHSLGRAAYGSLGMTGAFDGMPGTDSAPLLRICNAAYLHGVIESHLRSRESAADASSEAERIDEEVCSAMSDVAGGVWECRHGIGHGIVQRARDAADGASLEEAVGACRVPSLGAPYARACENGVWMDQFASARMSPAIGTFDFGTAAPTLRLCGRVAESVTDCAVYAPTEYLLRRPRDYRGALRWCAAAASAGGLSALVTNTCVKGVGSQAGKENLRDYRPVEEACLTAPKNLQRPCMDMAFQYRSFSTGDSAMPPGMCEQLNEFKDICSNFEYNW